MEVTLKEIVTRFHTIEVDDEYKDMDSSELDSCTEIRDTMFESIAIKGWDEEYVHEATFYDGNAPDTIYYKG